MEFKKVEDESYLSISRYIETLYDIHESLYGFSKTTINGVDYYFSVSEDGIACTYNNEGNIDYYFFENVPEEEKHDREINDISIIWTDEFQYRIDDAYKFLSVTRKDRIKGHDSQLCYTGVRNDDTKWFVTEVRSNDTSVLRRVYDVSSHSGLEGAMSYTFYNSPSFIDVFDYKKILFFNKCLVSHYGLNEDKKAYTKFMFTKNDAYFLPIPNDIDIDVINDYIKFLGYDLGFDNELRSILTGNNEKINLAKELKKEYVNFVRRQ